MIKLWQIIIELKTIRNIAYLIFLASLILILRHVESRENKYNRQVQMFASAQMLRQHLPWGHTAERPFSSRYRPRDERATSLKSSLSDEK